MWLSLGVDGEVLLMVGVHVDDIKVSGEKELS